MVELLVVIATVGILVGLLLPAVQRSREAARLIQCQNNLKQIGLGLHAYHGAYHSLPPGFTGGFEVHKDDKRWGWGTFLLPFIEQQPLYESLDPINQSLFRTVFDNDRRPILQTPVETYLCPSDVGDLIAEARRDFSGPSPPGPIQPLWHLNHLGFQSARSNYVGSFGDFWKPNYGLWNMKELRGTGAMGCNSNRRFRDITDGLAHTLAVGERDWFRYAAVWAGVEAWNQCHTQGISMVTASAYYNINLPPTPYPYTCDGRGAAGFGSLHAAGANFLLCDGSVHFISETIDSNPVVSAGETEGLFQNLARINDGNTIDDF